MNETIRMKGNVGENLSNWKRMINALMRRIERETFRGGKYNEVYDLTFSVKRIDHNPAD